MRGTAFLLDPCQIQDLAVAAGQPRGSGGEALALCAQLGAGLSEESVAALLPDQIDVRRGTINVGGRVVGVLADAMPFLAAAQDALRREPHDELRGTLPDALARPLWLVTHLHVGTPLSVVNDASVTCAKRPVQRHELERLLRHLHRPALDRIPANAGPDWWGTVGLDLLAEVRALKAALTVSGPEVPSPMAVTSPKGKPRQRKMSRAAALRSAREAQAQSQVRRDPLYLEQGLSEVPGWSTLPGDIANDISAYWPRRVNRAEWHDVEQIVRRLLVLRLTALNTPDAPVTKRKVNVIGSHLAPYAVWVRQHLDHRGPQELAQLILEETSLDRYTSEAMLTEPRATIATRRSEVRGALRAARPGPGAPKLTYRPIRPPYLTAEAVYHVRLAMNQPTVSRKRGSGFIVAAGYGAGLDGRDMGTVRACDIFTVELSDGEEAVLIRVGGERPRTVVVRQEYEDLLLSAVHLHHQEGRGRNGLMLGRKPGRRNVTTPAFEQLVTADGRHVTIEVPRLRSTWLVAHMSSAVPLGTLLTAAGLRSARALTDLLPFTTTPDEDDRVRLLRSRPGILPIPAPDGNAA